MIGKIKKKFLKVIKSKDLFVIEKSFMRMLGIWPGIDISIAKVCVLEVIFISLAYVPITISLVKSIKMKNFHSMAQDIPPFLVCNLNITIPIILLSRARVFKELINLFEGKWYQVLAQKFPEWEKTRKETVKKGNKILLLILTLAVTLNIPFYYIRMIYKTICHILDNFETTENITILKAE
jgi:hypothetical protein